MTGRKPRTIGYRQIASTLVSEIQGGKWTLDSPFPTEMELVERFQVGRNTVREALRELQDLGYIKRRRGARSVLVNASPESAFVNAVRSAEELLDYAKITKATILTTETVIVDDKLSRRLDIPAGSEWVRLGLLRHREGQAAPFAYSEVYVLPRFADVIESFGAEGELFSLIERRHGIVISRVEQEIEATLVDANIASRLSVPVDSPSLFVRSKFYSSEGDLVEIGLVSFPASRYKVRLALDRRGAAAAAA
ncbi:GntR family transcriptional regulator [Paracoccus sp. S-4012]|uniref:GntR family transcriptional regulator n=1 Tax=Paracoccus sp. S-4012 TaxID=2665648 RepID=UPI0018A1D21D|nr:GntR family transcriptional regulator [Paracoccus sp. S-4012]